MFGPSISAPIVNGSTDTSSKETLVIVGQSNDSEEGIFKDIEYYDHSKINTKFGESSHIAAMLRDVITMYSDSVVKPELFAISYQDVSTHTARVLKTTITGTATEDCTLYININSLNPDRITAQTAAVASLRMTKSAYCSPYTINDNAYGKPALASEPFTPLLPYATDNDVEIEVLVYSGETDSEIAAKINTAINASSESLYSSSVSTNEITLTCKHKGSIGNFISFEIIKSYYRDAGFTTSTVEFTAGAGVPDASDILDIEDEDNKKLSELTFHQIVLPYGYSVSNLKNDSYDKYKNLLTYNNKNLQYLIFKGVAVDTSDFEAVDTIANANPIEEKGVVKCIIVCKLSGLTIKDVSSYTESAYLKSKQFTPFQYDKQKKYNIGQSSTLTDITLFKPVSAFYTTLMCRKFMIEIKSVIDYAGKSWSFGSNNRSDIMNKSLAIALFNKHYSVLIGKVSDAEYETDYCNLLDNNEFAQLNAEKAFENAIVFDKTTGQLSLKAIYELLTPINSIIYPQVFK